MARAIFDRGEQRLGLAKDFQYLLSEIYVGPFVISADVVDLSWLAFVHNQVYRFTVVEHVNPVAHIESITVDRHWVIVQSVQDDCGDELLGVLLGTVVVAATRDDYRQSISMMVGFNQ